MPFVELQSNLAAGCFSEDFLKKLSSCAAASLNKPEDVSVYSVCSSFIGQPGCVIPHVCRMERARQFPCRGPMSNIVLLSVAASQTRWVSVCFPPPQRMNVVVKPGLPMLIAGSCSPCACVSVSAIGVTDCADKNKEHSARIFEFLSRELGLSEDR